MSEDKECIITLQNGAEYLCRNPKLKIRGGKEFIIFQVIREKDKPVMSTNDIFKHFDIKGEKKK